MWNRFIDLLDAKIFRHFRESHHKLSELGLASAIGLFWALTPLVGVQMIIVSLNWLLFRALRIHVHLVIALAWVWVSNPITMGPMYLAFYNAGYYIFTALGEPVAIVTLASLEEWLSTASDLGMWNGLLYWLDITVFQLGWPMLVGGFAIGFPIAGAAYPLTNYFVKRHRKKKAEKLGMTYEEWEREFVVDRNQPKDAHHPQPANKPHPTNKKGAAQPSVL